MNCAHSFHVGQRLRCSAGIETPLHPALPSIRTKREREWSLGWFFYTERRLRSHLQDGEEAEEEAVLECWLRHTRDYLTYAITILASLIVLATGMQEKMHNSFKRSYWLRGHFSVKWFGIWRACRVLSPLSLLPLTNSPPVSNYVFQESKTKHHFHLNSSSAGVVDRRAEKPYLPSALRRQIVKMPQKYRNEVCNTEYE